MSFPSYAESQWDKDVLRGNLTIVSRNVGEETDVLFGRKKRGRFIGEIVLPGGKVDFNDDVTDLRIQRAKAAARELEEETGIHRKPQELRHVGSLFAWGDKPASVDIFRTAINQDTPVESDELIPEWRRVGSDGFYNDMPDDVPIWFNAALDPEQSKPFRLHVIRRGGQILKHTMEKPDEISLDYLQNYCAQMEDYEAESPLFLPITPIPAEAIYMQRQLPPRLISR